MKKKGINKIIEREAIFKSYLENSFVYNSIFLPNASSSSRDYYFSETLSCIKNSQKNKKTKSAGAAAIEVKATIYK